MWPRPVHQALLLPPCGRYSQGDKAWDPHAFLPLLHPLLGVDGRKRVRVLCTRGWVRAGTRFSGAP